MHKRGLIARSLVVGVAALGLVVGGLFTAAPANAADMAVSVSPVSTTTNSAITTTYTLTYSCSNGAGSCANAVVTIPTTTITGNGSITDFASWIGTTSCPAPDKTVAGRVSFSLGTLGTGTNTCQFTVTPPDYKTQNNAVATITASLSSSNSIAATAAAVTLTATAARNANLTYQIPAQVTQGGAFEYAMQFNCAANTGAPQGDLGTSALELTATLPANFEYQSYRLGGSIPGTVTYNSTTRVVTYSDPTGTTCGATNRLLVYVSGTATTAGVPNAVGTQICITTTGTWTYIDGFSTSGTSGAGCTNVIAATTTVGKSVATSTLGNLGQNKFTDGSSPTYTYPGDWDGSGASTYFDLVVGSVGGAKNAGVVFDIKDPMPCLTSVSGGVYSSNAVGNYCTAPAFIPTLVTPFNFPTAGIGSITVIYTDGTSGTVPYTAGKGWVIPTSPAVAELNIPPFAAEGSNTAGTMVFRVFGYAAASVQTPSELRNTVSSTPYPVGSSTPLSATQTASRLLLVAAPPANAGAIVFPALTTARVGSTCAATVSLTGTNTYSGSRIEIPTGPSQAIYIDYLAPAGATAVNAPTTTFTLSGLGPTSASFRTFTSAALAPTVISNYNDTNRTLVRYEIPAGLAAQAGQYRITSASFVSLTLEAGCAGTYQSDVTIGYGAPITYCYLNNARVTSLNTVPLYPYSNSDLRSNGAPTAGNYCGESAPLKIDAFKPGFTVDKKVQGNLDPSPIGSGGTGHVSDAGGTATYTVSFTNSGESTLANPVMYDLLPRVGDTRASSTAARGSQFPVTLTSLGSLPANLTVAYSQTGNPCRPEVLPSNPGCVDDWSTTAPSPLSKTTALRFVYTGNVTVGNGFTATYSVSTPAAAAGNTAWNSVGTNVTGGDALVGAAESSLTGLQAQSAQPAITKTADRTTVDTVGQPIIFTFTVTNNTAVTLSNVRVADVFTDAASSSVAPAATCTALTTPAASCSGAATTLVPGQSATFTATYVTTQADLDHGRISDQATATANPPSGPGLSNSSGIVTVTATQTGALSLTKSASPTTVGAVGDTVTYTFSLTNTGKVTLRTLGVTEKSFTGSGALSAITCPSGALAPGASADCTATYPVTQADLTAGSITNSAAATARTPANVTVTSADSTATVTVDQAASLVIVKSATPSAETAYVAGQVITYSYVVSNTGNIPVTGIVVNEQEFTGTGALSAIDCPATSLDPASQFTCTATYTLTQEDVDSGSLSNTANATGTASTGPVTADDSTVTTPQEAESRLTLTKTSSTSFVNAAGDTYSYSFVIRNTGNVTIHDVEAQETEFSGTGDAPVVICPTTTLVPGQQIECTADYTVTQADMNAGTITNTAVAVGVDPTDATVTSASSTAIVTANVAAGVSLEKTADVASYDAVGTAITFSFLITNTGNVDLTELDVAEGDFTGGGALSSIDCPSIDLAPGESATCAADYETTQEDLDRGSIDNTAVALAQTPAGASLSSPASTVSIPAAQTPGLELEKSIDSSAVVHAAGDMVTYTFRVANTGNVTLTGVTIAETEFSGTGGIATPDCGASELAPGADRSCQVTYQVTQEDVDAGTVANTAVATAVAGATPVSSELSTATLTIDRTPALSLVKSASPAAPVDFAAGAQITYSFVITNTGNVTITEPGVEEGDFSGTGTLDAPTCESTGPLAPGAQLICTTVYTVTQADIDSASVTNTATAVGSGPDGSTPLTPPSSTVTVPEPAAPSLGLVKATEVTKLSTVGQIVTYTFTITNTGNTTATEVGVQEGAFSGHGVAPVPHCPTSTLLPGQSVSCAASYTVVAADLDGAPLRNSATAFASSPSGSLVTSDVSSVSIDDVVTTTDSTMALTGSTVAWGAGVAALTLVAAGAVLVITRRRRQRA